MLRPLDRSLVSLSTAALTLALVLLSTLVTAGDAAAQLSGAIYTSTSNGSAVNGNLYAKDKDVYLTGGPQPNAPCSSQGLPNGRYYFQVTDPSGGALLSTDSIDHREVLVSGGVVVAHITGTHKTGNGPCGSKTVQLVPFLSAPNGSEYKLWMTPVASYEWGRGAFGFLPKYSKTDNFKIKEPGKPIAQSVIRGFKFYDFNENSVWDAAVAAEVPIPGWRIEIWKGTTLDGVTYTDDIGRYTFIRDQDGSIYTIKEVAPPPGFIPAVGATWLAMTPTQGTVIANADQVLGPCFGNLHFEVLLGAGRTKGFWHNQNGMVLLQQCDPDWRTALNPPQLCLWYPSGMPFVVPAPPAAFATAFAAFSDWLVGQGATGHAGYLLGTQVAATILNNRCGFMQGTIYVDRFQNGVLMSLKDLIAGATGLLCDPCAPLTGPNDPCQDLRAMMLGCLNEFDTINNTGSLNTPQIVYAPSATPPDTFGLLY